MTALPPGRSAMKFAAGPAPSWEASHGAGCPCPAVPEADATAAPAGEVEEEAAEAGNSAAALNGAAEAQKDNSKPAGGVSDDDQSPEDRGHGAVDAGEDAAGEDAAAAADGAVDGAAAADGDRAEAFEVYPSGECYASEGFAAAASALEAGGHGLAADRDRTWPSWVADSLTGTDAAEQAPAAPAGQGVRTHADTGETAGSTSDAGADAAVADDEMCDTAAVGVGAEHPMEEYTCRDAHCRVVMDVTKAQPAQADWDGCGCRNTPASGVEMP